MNTCVRDVHKCACIISALRGICGVTLADRIMPANVLIIDSLPIQGAGLMSAKINNCKCGLPAAIYLKGFTEQAFNPSILSQLVSHTFPHSFQILPLRESPDFIHACASIKLFNISID